MVAKRRGTGARTQATKRAAVKKTSKAYKAYDRKKKSEASAFGTFPKKDTAAARAKRAAAAKQREQATKRSPRKVSKKK